MDVFEITGELSLYKNGELHSTIRQECRQISLSDFVKIVKWLCSNPKTPPQTTLFLNLEDLQIALLEE